MSTDPAADSEVPTGHITHGEANRIREEMSLLTTQLNNAVEVINRLTTHCAEEGTNLPNIPGQIAGSVAHHPRGEESTQPSNNPEHNKDRLTPASQRSKSKGKHGPNTKKKGKQSSGPTISMQEQGDEQSDHDYDTDSSKRNRSHSSRKKTPQVEETSSEDESPKCSSRFKRQTSALPGIKPFKFGEPDADWTSWVLQFTHTIQGHLDTESDKELHKACLRLIPAYLNPMAHTVYANCTYKNDWTKINEMIPCRTPIQLHCRFNHFIKGEHRNWTEEEDIQLLEQAE